MVQNKAAQKKLWKLKNLDYKPRNRAPNVNQGNEIEYHYLFIIMNFSFMHQRVNDIHDFIKMS